MTGARIEVRREEVPILTFFKVRMPDGKYNLRVRKEHDCDNDWELTSFLRAYLTVLEGDNLGMLEFGDEVD